uniref:Fibronectin type-III domain-containing protein n=1 Tax=Panagrolaimus sp. ES5 TaxID=591445 RepID=A0AC34F9A1_9BILA
MFTPIHLFFCEPTILPIPRGSGATTPLKGIIPNAIPSTSNGNGASPKSISPPVPVQFSQGPLMNPEMIADPNYLAIRNLQQQQANQWNGSKRSSSGYVPIAIPPDTLLHPAQYAAMTGYSILPHSLPPNNNTVIHTGNPYNGLIPGSGPVGDETDYEFEEDERERERLREALASIAAPQIQRIYPKEVEVSWQEIDTSEAAASGGPFPQIDASEFIYEVFVYEGKPQGSPASCHRCEPQTGNVLKIEKLKPNTQYCVNVRATLPERDVTGAFSQPAFFRTLSILHEIPPPPKIGSRGPTWMQVSWKNALNMSLLIKTIVVQYAKAKGEFITFCESSTDQVRITGLEPSSSYRIRIILRTEMGDTEPSQPSYAQTASSNAHQQLPPPPQSQQQGIVQQQPLQQPLQQQQQQQHQHLNGPSSSSMEVKIPPPQINGCFNRSIRLVWTPVYGVQNYILEYCEARSNEFHPIDDRDYTNNGGASVGHLQSNREYYFRLCVATETGQILRSEIISARTRKDHYENSSYQSNQITPNTTTSLSGAAPNTSSSYYDTRENRDRLQIPTQLQKTYIDEKTLELTWRYNGREFDTLIFILEGSIASNENNNQPESSWRICYKGPNTSAIINDITLNLFRVQAMNSRKHTSSTWSEPLFVKRVVQRSKRSIPDSSSSNVAASSTISSTTAASSSSAAPVVVHTPSTCTVPKFFEITWCSMQVQWKLSEALNPETSNNKISLIYELQRVDTEPIIIYSGDQTQYKLENLKPIEHVQVRARAVIVDYSGKRNEGDWSPIGSACTTCTAPSPPVNLRLAVEGPIPTLAWDPPTQLNGANIKSYVLTGTKTPLTGDATEKPILKRFGETSKTELSLGKVEPATHFAIKIIAISKGGESDASEIFEFDSPSTEPEAPQELHIEAISSTELSLSWTPGAENGSPITGYRLLVHELSSESRSASKHLVAQHQISEDITTFVASKLKPETLYELEIVAKNSIGVSESVSMRCETFASPPDPPELSLVQAQSNVLKLKWQPAIASSSSSTVEPCYFYLEKENDFGTFSPVFEGESKMAKIKNLHEDTVHRFRIRSAHAKGIASLMGPWSETYEFSTTRPPPPSVKGSLMVSEVSQSVFQIEWLPVKLVTNDGTDNFVYRLQVVPKPERRNVLEPWKTVYEGTCPSYTLSLSPQSSTARMARVFVVQKLGNNNEELCSAPSAIAQFSSCRTPNESPRKRINKVAASGNSTPSQPSEDDQPTRSPSSVHRANRMNWQRRAKKWINFVRKTFADRNNSAVVLVCAIVLVLIYFMMF